MRVIINRMPRLSRSQSASLLGFALSMPVYVNSRRVLSDSSGSDIGDKLANNGIVMQPTLSLEIADRIATNAIKAAIKYDLPPITVTVIDSSGEIIVTKKMDGCTPAFPKFAYAKAWTAACFKMSSRTFRDKYTPPGKPHTADKYGQMLSMVNISGGNLAPFPGGIVIREIANGPIVAGVGVSGASGDEDEFCALAGVHDLQLKYVTEPSTHSCTHLVPK
eukprot:gene9051-18748_t